MRDSVPTRAVIVTIGVVVMIVLAVFFTVSLGMAQRDVAATTQSTQAVCQTECQNIVSIAFNYDSCEALFNNQRVRDYQEDCVNIYGSCTVTVKDSVTCLIE